MNDCGQTAGQHPLENDDVARRDYTRGDGLWRHLWREACRKTTQGLPTWATLKREPTREALDKAAEKALLRELTR